MPSLFAPHFEDLYICSSDSYHIKTLKLEILASIATDSSIMSIFKEFQVSSPLMLFLIGSCHLLGSIKPGLISSSTVYWLQLKLLSYLSDFF